MTNVSEKKNYSVSKVPSYPLIGHFFPCIRDPINFTADLAHRYGDIITFNVMGHKTVQLNHPDLIRYVLVDNHKNYKKNKAYKRFESAGGLGLLTSHGQKWKRDRQKIQPLFSRELITTYHFEIANKVSERYREKWLKLTQNGPVELDITHEMALIPTEIILRVVFGDNIHDDTIRKLHESYSIMMEYLKDIRIFPDIDLRKLFCMPSYFKFRDALKYIDSIIKASIQECHRYPSDNQRNMLALLVNAQRNDPDYFTDDEIRSQCITMIFAGFETTSITLQWMWYAMDGRPDIYSKIRHNILDVAPFITSENSHQITYNDVFKMDYLTACFRETLRLYPALWLTGREPVEDDQIGDFFVSKGTIVVIPQFAMQRHPRYWKHPNEFIPERFLPLDKVHIDDGIYFPFSHGPRKCIGSLFSEMEIKLIMAKLVPLFDVMALNKQNNPLIHGISLKLKNPLKVRISRAVRESKTYAVSRDQPLAEATKH
jgi:cytochrome P450